MMDHRFNGFSQEEINKVTASRKSFTPPAAAASAEATTRPPARNGIRRMPDKPLQPKTSSSTQTQAAKLTKQNVAATVASGDVVSKTSAPATKATSSSSGGGGSRATLDSADVNLSDVNLDTSMSKSIEEALFFAPMKPKAPPATGSQQQRPSAGPAANDSEDGRHGDGDMSSILQMPATKSAAVEATNDSLQDYMSRPPQETAAAAEVLNTDSPFRGISLKDFETHRRMIEEQNKQKKELLYKAIEHHSQKTKAESRKIEEIRHELAKLDNDLAVDVAIIRKQIDNASIMFSTIEKQYVKIEAQFLKAKMDLHNAAEKKELLTEHLCTVIAHNEDRKAEKLSELMAKVGLTPSGDYETPREELPPNGGGGGGGGATSP